jgi:hypothetical protein
MSIFTRILLRLRRGRGVELASEVFPNGSLALSQFC